MNAKQFRIRLRMLILMALSSCCLGLCSRFGESSTSELDQIVPLGFLLEPSGDCAFIRSPGTDDFQVEVRPIPPTGCNEPYYFGLTYDDYVRKERQRMIDLESFLEQTAPSSCTSTITAVQGYISSPATNPALISTTNYSQRVGFQVVDGVTETKGSVVQDMEALGLTTDQAVSEMAEARTASVLEYEKNLYLIIGMLLASAEPSCDSALRGPVNELQPGWVADQRMDDLYIPGGIEDFSPVIFLSRCSYGSANIGNQDFCANLR